MDAFLFSLGVGLQPSLRTINVSFEKESCLLQFSSTLLEMWSKLTLCCHLVVISFTFFLSISIKESVLKSLIWHWYGDQELNCNYSSQKIWTVLCCVNLIRYFLGGEKRWFSCWTFPLKLPLILGALSAIPLALWHQACLLPQYMVNLWNQHISKLTYTSRLVQYITAIGPVAPPQP